MAWSDDARKRTFQCWSDMKQRCYNKKSAQYKNYGGRGISVCDRWVNSFENFVADMGVRPDGMSIERVDVDGNYCAENCKWLGLAEQQKNKRNNRLIAHDGRTMTLRDWAKELGRHETTLHWRLRRGYPVEMVLSKEKLLFGNIDARAAMGEPK